MKRKNILKLLSTGLALTLLLTACVAGDDPVETDPSDDPSVEEPGDATDPSDDPDETDDPVETEQGETLRIYVWNEEWQDLFNTYYADRVPEGINVEWVLTPNEDNAYQDKLDQDLLKQFDADPEDRIDLFLVEADYALKYVNSEYSMDVYNEIGLTEEDLSQQYQYTKEIVTDDNGVLKGTSWQATPGLFAYRRSIAQDVLGTDDPAEVQEYLSDWTKFDEVAAQAADKGYKMLSGYDDSYRTFSNNVAAPWVDGTQIVVDENIETWIDQTKEYTEKGYNNKTALWAPEWSSDQGPEGNVFGFFYSTWGINFTLLGNSLETPVDAGGVAEVGNGIYGDWAVTPGPEPYYWGGTWLIGATGSDNVELVRDIMYAFTADAEFMKQITLDTQDYTNNEGAMNEIANSDYSSDFLGGQNHIALFADVAPEIDMSNISIYDQGLNESIQEAFRDYFDGNITKEEAYDNFYTSAIEKYPELTR